MGRAGRLPEAIRELEEALRIKPDLVRARHNLGVALRASGRIPEADAQFEEAKRLQATSAGTAH